MSRIRKLSYRWLGPYRVRKAIPNKGTYFLEEFDGTELAGSYSGNRLKKFVQRKKFYMPVATDTDAIQTIAALRTDLRMAWMLICLLWTVLQSAEVPESRKTFRDDKTPCCQTHPG